MYERRLPLIIWGDGGQARLADIRPPEKNQLGIWVTKILFQPTEELKEREGITEEDLTFENKGMWKEYEKDMVHWLDKSPRDAVLLILCSFKGEETVLTRLTKGLIELNRVRDEIENNLKVMVAGLLYELRMFMSERKDLIKMQKEVMEELKPPKEEKDEE